MPCHSWSLVFPFSWYSDLAVRNPCKRGLVRCFYVSGSSSFPVRGLLRHVMDITRQNDSVVITRSCPYAYHDPMWGIRGTASLTFNPGARWRWVVSFTCWLIYFWYPLNRRLGGPQVSLSNLEKRNSLVTPGIVLWIIQHVAWSLYQLSCLSSILKCCGFI